MGAIKKKQNFKNTYAIIGWTSPSLILFGLFLLFPLFFSVILTFFDWSGFSRDPFNKFIGFENYLKLFKDTILLKSLQNNIILVIILVVLLTVISLFTSLIIYFGKFKYDSIIRATIFFPSIISYIVIGLVFRKFLSMQGIFNEILNTVGLGKFAAAWLSDQKLVIWVVSIVVVWQSIGWVMVIFYAALQNLDHEIIEAAFIDGANIQKTLFHIVIPVIKPSIFLVALLNFIGGFRVFEIIWILTRGGPAHASEILTTYMYYISFQSKGPSDMGYGATVAILLAVIIIIFAIIRIIIIKKSE